MTHQPDEDPLFAAFQRSLEAAGEQLDVGRLHDDIEPTFDESDQVDTYVRAQKLMTDGVSNVLFHLELSGLPEAPDLRDRFFAKAVNESEIAFGAGIERVEGDITDEAARECDNPDEQQRLLRLSHMARAVTLIGTAYATQQGGSQVTGAESIAKGAYETIAELEGSNAEQLRALFSTVARTVLDD